MVITPDEISANNLANEEKRLRRAHSLTPQDRMVRFAVRLCMRQSVGETRWSMLM
jgi:hypothetical protein